MLHVYKSFIFIGHKWDTKMLQKKLNNVSVFQRSESVNQCVLAGATRYLLI